MTNSAGAGREAGDAGGGELEDHVAERDAAGPELLFDRVGSHGISIHRPRGESKYCLPKSRCFSIARAAPAPSPRRIASAMARCSA